jgi:formylmethanofuran--tetrahydromethanopterin N-formyltransferase
LVKQVEIEDTYAEVFDGLYCRVIVTADDMMTLRKAVQGATATPSIVIGRVEGGVERWLSEGETPDSRLGAVLQFWAGIDEGKPLPKSVERFEKELSYRIRQNILVKPFTAVFDFLPNPLGRLDMMKRVGHCGDGFEWTEKFCGREVIVVPLMVPDFKIERYIGYAKGVMGANFWFMCRTKKAVVEGGEKALEAIHLVEGVITPFDVCSAGSKPETKFPWIGPTTNHPYCPSLRKRLGKVSRVTEDVNYIPEIVINGVSMDALKKAMKAGVRAVCNVEGVTKISAGNYEGKLGKYKIFLRGLFR